MARPSQTGAILKVRVQPKASSNRVVGYHGDTLRVQVTALPQDGKANAAVVALLAETLGVPKSRVRIVRGHTARDKVVTVGSLTVAEVERRIIDLAG